MDEENGVWITLLARYSYFPKHSITSGITSSSYGQVKWTDFISSKLVVSATIYPLSILTLTQATKHIPLWAVIDETGVLVA